jgi:hypothetical protein
MKKIIIFWLKENEKLFDYFNILSTIANFEWFQMF